MIGDRIEGNDNQKVLITQPQEIIDRITPLDEFDRQEININYTEKPNGRKKIQYALPLSEMIKRVKEEPPMKMIYSGIKENSVGFIFGPGKSGKTIFCENLGMSIAAGLPDYLGLPIKCEKQKVLFISLEEFYTGRTERNGRQAEKISSKLGEKWLENFLVVNENIPRYLVTQEDWDVIRDIIREANPEIVFIDSLGRMHEGSIEDSSTAKAVMKNLRELSNGLKITLVVIHHTPKLYNTALTLSTLAGSRIVGQEADFVIGINKTLANQRYIKDVAFRYAPDDQEKVRMVTIDDHRWLNISGEVEEARLLAVNDGRRDDVNKLKLFDFISEKGDITENKIVTFAEIEARFSGEMSSQTSHSQLKKLVDEGKIVKPGKGQYKLNA